MINPLMPGDILLDYGNIWKGSIENSFGKKSGAPWFSKVMSNAKEVSSPRFFRVVLSPELVRVAVLDLAMVLWNSDLVGLMTICDLV